MVCLLDLIKLAVMGQVLEDIVLRGTDIHAFAPMIDQDRAQVRIITHVFCCGPLF